MSKIEMAAGANVGALMAAQSFTVFALVAALVERELVDQNRVAAYAEHFGEIFALNPTHPASDEIAAHLKNFASHLRTLSTAPEDAGWA